MEKEKVWFYLALAWTVVGIFSILFSWLYRLELSVYWFGCIIMSQLCFIHRELASTRRAG